MTDEQIKELENWLFSNAGIKALNEHIEESGANLTLAEKNLIAVTKLLLKKNSSIILLDDLSSCLDNKMQKIVYEAIYNTFPKSTVIVITHEIKDFMKIDKVMSIQNGEIVENIEI